MSTTHSTPIESPPPGARVPPPTFGTTRPRVSAWTTTDVTSWLHENKCGSYSQAFLDNDITGAVLLDVDQQALKEMGIQSVGDRIRITIAVNKLRQAARTPTAASPSSKAGTPVVPSSLASSAGSLGHPQPNTNSAAHPTWTSSSSSNRQQARIPPPLSLSSATTRDPRLPRLAPTNSPPSSSNNFNVSRSNSYSSQKDTTSSSASRPSLSPHPSQQSVNRSGMSVSPSPNHSSAQRSGLHMQPPSISTTVASPTAPTSSSSSRWGPVPVLSLSKAGQMAQSHRKTGSLSSTANTPTSLSQPQPSQSIRPSTASGSTQIASNPYMYHSTHLNQPLSNHPYATSASPTLEIFRASPSRQGSNSSIGAPRDLSPVMESGHRAAPSDPSLSKPSTSSGYSAHQGFTVGRGPFSRPNTSSGGPVVNFAGANHPTGKETLEDLVRKTIKFSLAEGTPQAEAGTTAVTIEVSSTGKEMLAKALKKFGKISSATLSSQDIKESDGEYCEVEGWGVLHVEPGGTPRLFTDEDFVNFAQTATFTERQRGLIIRRIHHLPSAQGNHDPRTKKSSRKIRDFFGEEILSDNIANSHGNRNGSNNRSSGTSPLSPTHMLDVRIQNSAPEPTSQTPSSPASASSEQFTPAVPQDVNYNSRSSNMSPTSTETSPTLNDSMSNSNTNGSSSNVDKSDALSETKSRKSLSTKRASTVSVMSGLLDWADLDQQLNGSQTSSKSNKTSLASTGRRIRHFFGHRPPSELISTHLVDYFPTAEGKKLGKAVRQSMRKSIARRESQYVQLPPLPNGYNAIPMPEGASRFSNSSGSTEAPPVPQKDFILSPDKQRTIPLPNNNSEQNNTDEISIVNIKRKSMDSLRVPSSNSKSSPAPSEVDATSDTSKNAPYEPSVRGQSLRNRPLSRSSMATNASDVASVLTMDDINQEVENRRLSISSGVRASMDSLAAGDSGRTSSLSEKWASETSLSPTMEEDEDEVAVKDDSRVDSPIDVQTSEEEEEESEEEEEEEEEEEVEEEEKADFEANPEAEEKEKEGKESRAKDQEEEDEEDEDENEDEEDEEAAVQMPPGHGVSKSGMKWVRGILIGCGSFGKVYLAMNARVGTLMAVKQVELPTGKSQENTQKKKMLVALQREIELMKDLQHEHIVRYLDFSSDKHFLNILLEYVPGGSVATLLKNCGAFGEEVVQKFVKQILLGLDYLHERDIIHRDIKGANILVDNKGCIKISDFGISKKVEDNLLSNARKFQRASLAGSVFWMAPEVVKQVPYTKKADIWSCGCLIVEMFTGEHPYAELTQMQAIFRIGSQTTAGPEHPEDISDEAEDFLNKTFQIDHTARPSAAELLRHSWLVMESEAETPTTSSFRIAQEQALQADTAVAVA